MWIYGVPFRGFLWRPNLMAFRDTKEGDIWLPKASLHFLEHFFTDDYKYYKTDDQYIVGIDGFKCPRDYTEFLDRYPDYVMAYTYKQCHRVRRGNLLIDQWDDIVGEMVLHILTISKKSDLHGKVRDRIEAFDPQKQHGAKKGQFFNWVNKVIKNQFNTVVYHKMSLDALYYSVPILEAGEASYNADNDGRGDFWGESNLVLDTHHDMISDLNTQDLLECALTSINKSQRPQAEKILGAFLVHNTHKEIAEELDISPKEVGVVLGRIRNRCKLIKV